jgi:hypothetical protein
MPHNGLGRRVKGLHHRVHANLLWVSLPAIGGLIEKAFAIRSYNAKNGFKAKMRPLHPARLARGAIQRHAKAT